MTEFKLTNPSEKPPMRCLVWKCAWCGRLHRSAGDMPLSEHWMQAIFDAQCVNMGGPSHGMCPECAEREERKLTEHTAAVVNDVMRP